jgi:hypothetical protein
MGDVPDQSHVNLALHATESGTNSGNVVIPMAVLVGDVNASGIVTTADVNLCKGRALFAG